MLIVVSGYLSFDRMFPKATSIKCSAIEDISSITVITDKGEEMAISDYSKVLQCIVSAKGTRKMSVHDYPNTRPYYELEIVSLEGVLRCFVYTEENTMYLEIPYIGVYKVDEAILEVIK